MRWDLMDFGSEKSLKVRWLERYDRFLRMDVKFRSDKIK